MDIHKKREQLEAWAADKVLLRDVCDEKLDLHLVVYTSGIIVSNYYTSYKNYAGILE